jgi:hypothetical protein
MNFFKHYGRTLFLTTLLTVGAIYCSGCSKKDNPANSDDGKDLICTDGEAWIKTIDGIDGGFIFMENGDMIGIGALPDGTWHGAKVGTYTAKDGKLTTVFTNGRTITETYKVSGNTLTLTGAGGTDVYTKKNDVYVN